MGRTKAYGREWKLSKTESQMLRLIGRQKTVICDLPSGRAVQCDFLLQIIGCKEINGFEKKVTTTVWIGTHNTLICLSLMC